MCKNRAKQHLSVLSPKANKLHDIKTSFSKETCNAWPYIYQFLTKQMLLLRYNPMKLQDYRLNYCQPPTQVISTCPFNPKWPLHPFITFCCQFTTQTNQKHRYIQQSDGRLNNTELNLLRKQNNHRHWHMTLPNPQILIATCKIQHIP